MSWLYDEELKVQRECNMRQLLQDKVDIRVVFFTAVFFMILIADYAFSFEPQAVECPRCCARLIVVDHIIPLSKGGLHRLLNLQYLTPMQNFEKASKIVVHNSVRELFKLSARLEELL